MKIAAAVGEKLQILQKYKYVKRFKTLKLIARGGRHTFIRCSVVLCPDGVRVHYAYSLSKKSFLF